MQRLHDRKLEYNRNKELRKILSYYYGSGESVSLLPNDNVQQKEKKEKSFLESPAYFNQASNIQNCSSTSRYKTL